MNLAQFRELFPETAAAVTALIRGHEEIIRQKDLRILALVRQVDELEERLTRVRAFAMRNLEEK